MYMKCKINLSLHECFHLLAILSLCTRNKKVFAFAFKFTNGGRYFGSVKMGILHQFLHCKSSPSKMDVFHCAYVSFQNNYWSFC